MKLFSGRFIVFSMQHAPSYCSFSSFQLFKTQSTMYSLVILQKFKFIINKITNIFVFVLFPAFHVVCSRCCCARSEIVVILLCSQYVLTTIENCKQMANSGNFLFLLLRFLYISIKIGTFASCSMFMCINSIRRHVIEEAKKKKRFNFKQNILNQEHIRVKIQETCDA